MIVSKYYTSIDMFNMEPNLLNKYFIDNLPPTSKPEKQIKWNETEIA